MRMTPGHLFVRSRAHRRGCCRCFTLVELMAAIAILVLLMYMLFRFISSAQTAWSLTNSSTEVYEKARIAFDLITRDLQAAVARSDDVPGRHIRFKQNAADELTFVSCTQPTRGSLSDFCEVGYHLDTYTFERALVDSPTCGWNIYETNPSEGTVNDQTGFQKVIGGVLSMGFVCYDDSMNTATWSGMNYETSLPFAVQVTMRLMDDQSFKTWQTVSGAARTDVENRAARSFTKMVFLGNRRLPEP